MIVGAAADALDEDTLFGNQALRFLSGHADDTGVLPHTVCAQIELVPGRPGPADRLLAAVLLLVALARLFKIDAEQSRAEQGDDDRGSDRAEDVGYGIGDRHAVEQVLGFLGRQPEAVDGVSAEPHRRRDRLRACVEAYRRYRRHSRPAWRRGRRPARQNTQCTDGEQGLRQTILGDATHELRPDRVADRKQEHEEEERLQRPRDRDAELADDHCRDQRRSHCAKAKPFIGKRPEVVPEGQGNEDGDLGILTQRVREPSEHGFPLLDFEELSAAAERSRCGGSPAQRFILAATASAFSSFSPLAFSKPWISFTSSLRMKSIVSCVSTWPGTMIGKPGG